jgi:hypothetical protein
MLQAPLCTASFLRSDDDNAVVVTLRRASEATLRTIYDLRRSGG